MSTTEKKKKTNFNPYDGQSIILDMKVFLKHRLPVCSLSLLTLVQGLGDYIVHKQDEWREQETCLTNVATVTYIGNLLYTDMGLLVAAECQIEETKAFWHIY